MAYRVDNKQRETQTAKQQSAEQGETAPVLNVDLSKYEHYLKRDDCTAAQKRQLVETLASILWMFIDFGFGVETTQLACGQSEKKSPDPAVTAPDEVECDNQIFTDEFIKAADMDCQSTVEGAET